jgi:hypothetical protein
MGASTEGQGGLLKTDGPPTSVKAPEATFWFCSQAIFDEYEHLESLCVAEAVVKENVAEPQDIDLGRVEQVSSKDPIQLFPLPVARPRARARPAKREAAGGGDGSEVATNILEGFAAASDLLNKSKPKDVVARSAGHWGTLVVCAFLTG